LNKPHHKTSPNETSNTSTAPQSHQTPTSTAPTTTNTDTTSTSANEGKTSGVKDFYKGGSSSYYANKHGNQSNDQQQTRQRPAGSFKERKAQNQFKKKRTESEVLEFIKYQLERLTSVFEKQTAGNNPTAEVYEEARHKMFKNFTFYKESDSMHQGWVDILYNAAIEKGIINTIGNMLKEQLAENVSQLAPHIIVEIKKKLAVACQKGFVETMTAPSDPSKQFEAEYTYYKRHLHNVQLIGKLVSAMVLEKTIAHTVISKLLDNPNELNMRLLSNSYPWLETRLICHQERPVLMPIWKRLPRSLRNLPFLTP